ncbi:MAG: ATP-grasp domain-containing protein [Candidatus Omnitrophica bacterium]|nr:ATP-grasp domain-containing protein [Candidatus Omnitrophota bacterium]
MKNDSNLLNKKVLIVGEGSPLKERFLKIGKDLGIEIFMVDSKPPSFSKKYLSGFVKINFFNLKESLQIINNYLLENNISIDGIVTYWERFVYPTAFFAKKLKLYGNSLFSASLCRNKFLLYSYLKKYKLFSKKFWYYRLNYNSDVLEERENIKRFIWEKLRKNKKIFILKPDSLAASKGVLKLSRKNFNNKEKQKKLDRLIEKLIENVRNINYKEYKIKGLILMDFIRGKEFSIEGYVDKNGIKIIQITEKFNIKGNYFVEKGDWSIPRLSKKNILILKKYVKEVIEKTKTQFTCFHMEVKWDKDLNKPQIIELNGRIGGDDIHCLVKNTYNFDLAKAMYEIAVNGFTDPPKFENPQKLGVAKYFLPPYNCKVININVSKKLSKFRNFIKELILPQKNSEYLTPPDGYDYFGWLTLFFDKNTKRKEALELINKIFKLIKFKLVKI